MKTHKPLRQRFLEKVEVDAETGCWLWTARIDDSGYGRFNRGPGLSPLAHRYAYEEYVGPIPDGLEIDHLCRVRHCVNPWHLEAVTPLQNLERGISFAAVNRRKSECANGHPLSGDNVRVVERRDGRRERECRSCSRDRKRAYKRRLREAA